MARSRSLLNVKAKKKRAPKATDFNPFHAPDWPTLKLDHPDYESNFGQALNYASFTFDAKAFKKEAIKKIKPKAAMLKAWNAVPDWKFTKMGKLCWILNNGGELTKAKLDKVSDDACNLSEEGKKVLATEDAKATEVVKVTKTVQERIAEQVDRYISDFETEVDTFISAGYKSEFSPIGYLRQHEVKAQQANQIGAFYQPLLDELQEAKGKIDDQLKEAYKGLTAQKLNRYIKFVQEIVDDTAMSANASKVVRKTRKPKVKTAAQLTKGVNFQVENLEFKLVSEDAYNLIGASQIWLFNTKYRELAVYNATKDGPIGLKGSKLFGFDEQKSFMKKIRKPADVLPKVTSSGKVALRKLMDTIKAKEKPVNGRINKNVIIVRTVRA